MEQPAAHRGARSQPGGCQSELLEAGSLNTSLHSEQSEVTVLVSVVKREPAMADQNNNSSNSDSGCCLGLQQPQTPPEQPQQLPKEETNCKDKCRSFVVLNSSGGVRKSRRSSLVMKPGSICCYLAPDGEAFSLVDWLRKVRALKNEFGGLEKQPPRLPTEAPSVRSVEAGLLRRAESRAYPVQRPGRGERNHYCRYQVAGICRLWRRDCPFSHQQQLTTCKFWHAGFCMKGTDCPFLHGYV